MAPSRKRQKKRKGSPDQAGDGPAKRKYIRPKCSAVGCPNISVCDGVCIRHGAKLKRCSVEGCPNQARKGGVCIRHGAELKRCNVDGCTNQAQKGGVCIRHGAKRKQCGAQGCTNKAHTGGVCKRHGAKRKQCRIAECANIAVCGGVCIRHGAKTKRCSVEGCPNKAHTGGVCVRHGAKRKRTPCSVGGCTNRAISCGVCISHGAKPKRKRCSFEGCTKLAQHGGVCVGHGAPKHKRCSVDGCTKQAKSGHGGHCQRHSDAICEVQGCSRKMEYGGLCRKHLRMRRVQVSDDSDDCNGAPAKKTCRRNKWRSVQAGSQGNPEGRGSAQRAEVATPREDATKPQLRAGEDVSSQRAQLPRLLAVPHSADEEVAAEENSDPPLSPYEQARLDRMARNKAFLEAKGLGDGPMIAKMSEEKRKRKRKRATLSIERRRLPGRSAKAKAGSYSELTEEQILGGEEGDPPGPEEGGGGAAKTISWGEDRREEEAQKGGGDERTGMEGGDVHKIGSDGAHNDNDAPDNEDVEDDDLVGTQKDMFQSSGNDAGGMGSGIGLLRQAVDDSGSDDDEGSVSVKEAGMDGQSHKLGDQETLREVHEGEGYAVASKEKSKGPKKTSLPSDEGATGLPCEEIAPCTELIPIAKSPPRVFRGSTHAMPALLAIGEQSPANPFELLNEDMLSTVASYACLEDLKLLRLASLGMDRPEVQDFMLKRPLKISVGPDVDCIHDPDKALKLLQGKVHFTTDNFIRRVLRVAKSGLNKVESVSVSEPRGYLFLYDMKDAALLKHLHIYKCLTQFRRKGLEYPEVTELVESLELFRSKLSPPLCGLLKEMGLKSLKFRRNIPFIDHSHGYFFEMLRSSNLTTFKFCQKCEDDTRIQFIADEEQASDADDVSPSDSLQLLNDRLLRAISSNRELKSLSLRGVVLRRGNGIAPLRELANLEELCLSAVTSFERADLEELSNIRSLRRLALFNCPNLCNNLDVLAKERLSGDLALSRLEELSLVKVHLSGNYMMSIGKLVQLKTLNVYGTLQSLERGLLHHLSTIKCLEKLSLQLDGMVRPDIALEIGGLKQLRSLCLMLPFPEEVDATGQNQDHQPDDFDNDVDAPEFHGALIHSDEESTFVACSLEDSSSCNSSLSGDAEDTSGIEDGLMNLQAPKDYLYGLHNLAHLQKLEIYDTRISDYFLRLLGDHLTSLVELTLWNCDELSMETIRCLKVMQKLEKLSLGGYRTLMKSSLDDLACLDSLETLELYSCSKLSEASLENLRLMKKLKQVVMCPYHRSDPGLPSHIKFVKFDHSADARIMYLGRERFTKGLF